MIIKYTNKKSIGGALRWDRFKEKTKSAFTKTKTSARTGIGASKGLGKDIFKSPKRLFFLPKRAVQSIKLGHSTRQLKSKVGFNSALLTQKLDKYKTKTNDLQKKITALQTAHNTKIETLKTKGKNTRAKEEKYAGQIAELKNKLIAKQQKTEDYIENKLKKTGYGNVATEYQALPKTPEGQVINTANKIKKFRESVASVITKKTNAHNVALTKKIDDKIKTISNYIPAKSKAKQNAADEYEILKKIDAGGTANHNEVEKHRAFLEPILGYEFFKNIQPRPGQGQQQPIKLSLEQRKLLTAAIPKALTAKFSAEEEYNKIASIKAKLEKAKSKKLEKEGLEALEQRVVRRQARFNESQAKYGFFTNTVKTAKSYAGLTSPYNKVKFAATPGIEKSLENAKTAKQTYKKSKRNTGKLKTLRTNVKAKIGIKKNQLLDLQQKLKNTINPTDRASIVGEMQILQRTIQKYERIKIRIGKFLPESITLPIQIQSDV